MKDWRKRMTTRRCLLMSFGGNAIEIMLATKEYDQYYWVMPDWINEDIKQGKTVEFLIYCPLEYKKGELTKNSGMIVGKGEISKFEYTGVGIYMAFHNIKAFDKPRPTNHYSYVNKDKKEVPVKSPIRRTYMTVWEKTLANVYN